MDSDDSDQDLKSVVSVTSAVSSVSGSSADSLPSVLLPWHWFSLRVITLIVLPLLSLIGAFGTFGLGSCNGMFDALTALIAQKDSFLPGHNGYLLRKYVGIKFIDYQLSVLVAFFAPTVDMSHSELTLFSIFGLGQFGAAWSLMVMEGMRMGNRGKAVSFIGTVGFLIQNITFTITTPLYLLLHLLTSPVAKPFPGTHANSVLIIPSWDLTMLPVSITLGYIIPSLLMGIPSPSVVPSHTHQKYIAFWQAFPIWTVIIHWSVRLICKFIANKVSLEVSGKRLATPLGQSYLSSAMHVYRFVLTICMVTHIPVVLLTLLPSWAFLDSALNLTFLAESNFFDVFVPYFPLPSYQVVNLGEGVLTFLQWDLYVGSAALLLWAVVLYRNATTEKTIVDPHTSLPISREFWLGERAQDTILWKKLLWKIGWWSMVSGPMGALTILLWERDAIVRQKIKQGV